jgi:septum site-determining protein MinC
MLSEQFKIKGLKNGMLVIIGEGSWEEKQASLLTQIDDNQAFFDGGKLFLDIGNRILKSPSIGELRNQLSDRNVKLAGILSTSLVTERASQDMGLAIMLDKTTAAPESLPINTNLEGDEAVLINKTLRSGHKVQHPGHVVVLGDVNPGAEIVAGGNIIVWGRLRGMVHAGAAGDKSAVVCALDLSPTQLRIADQISISPPRKGKTGPEVARLEDDQVTAQAW